jgi:hypothetical protein
MRMCLAQPDQVDPAVLVVVFLVNSATAVFDYTGGAR